MRGFDSCQTCLRGYAWHVPVFFRSERRIKASGGSQACVSEVADAPCTSRQERLGVLEEAEGIRRHRAGQNQAGCNKTSLMVRCFGETDSCDRKQSCEKSILSRTALKRDVKRNPDPLGRIRTVWFEGPTGSMIMSVI